MGKQNDASKDEEGIDNFKAMIEAPKYLSSLTFRYIEIFNFS